MNDEEHEYIATHEMNDTALHAVLSDMIDDGIVKSDGQGNYEFPGENFVEEVVGVCMFWFLKGYDSFMNGAMKHDETCECGRCVFEECIRMEEKGILERVGGGNWKLTKKGRHLRDLNN